MHSKSILSVNHYVRHLYNDLTTINVHFFFFFFFFFSPESAEIQATARTPSTAGKPITTGLPTTASMKGTAETLATPVTPAIAGRLATVTHQELKGRQKQQECLPLFGSKQASNYSSTSNKQLQGWQQYHGCSQQQERKQQHEWKRQQDRQHSMRASKSRNQRWQHWQGQ